MPTISNLEVHTPGGLHTSAMFPFPITFIASREIPMFLLFIYFVDSKLKFSSLTQSAATIRWWSPFYWKRSALLKHCSLLVLFFIFYGIYSFFKFLTVNDINLVNIALQQVELQICLAWCHFSHEHHFIKWCSQLRAPE